MPYIKPEFRQLLDPMLAPLIEHLKKENARILDGELNYLITKLLKNLYAAKYFEYNRALGVLEAVKQEYYRTAVGPYEEQKRLENGDVQ